MWTSHSKKLPKPGIVDVIGLNGLGANESALAFVAQFSPECCELLPANVRDDNPVALVHVYSINAFPAGCQFHAFKSGIGDFATAVNAGLLDERPLFRDQVLREDGTVVPGVYIYCTDDFRLRYEQAGLVGVLFEPYWPMKDRFGFLEQRIREDAAAKARGRLLSDISNSASPMPSGRVPKAEVSWTKRTQPTAEQLAAYLWQSVIDQRMGGHWIGDAAAADTSDALGITHLAAEAVARILEAGVDRNVLCHLARANSFEAIQSMLSLFQETGIDWSSDSPEWDELRIAMVQQGTVDANGSIGGWPPRSVG
jgi:hypothetical protein